MNQPTAIRERELFDEAAYRRMYPDVAAEIEGGRMASGWEHYDKHGRLEGRLGFGFDPDFYQRAYPLAIEEIRGGRATDPLEHYMLFGKSRGYLPNPRAPRPDNAAAPVSGFGGFWPDLPTAPDIIRGKCEIGQITERQAQLLTSWSRDGYVVLQHAIPAEMIDDALADLDKAYAGGFKDLLFECRSIAKSSYISWRPDINPYPAKALDIHHFSQAIRNLIFADVIGEFLGLIFESKAFASQTLGFLRGSAQNGHQDSAYVAYSIPRQFAATWIALEDVTLGCGELFYYVGSHKLEEFLFGGRYKSVYEVQRMNSGVDPQDEIIEHVESLERRANAYGMRKQLFAAKKGDVLVWHPDLVHGGNPVSRSTTRKSIVTHYCPKHVTPLFAEHLATKIYRHDGHLFTTSYYTDLDPVGYKAPRSSASDRPAQVRRKEIQNTSQ